MYHTFFKANFFTAICKSSLKMFYDFIEQNFLNIICQIFFKNIILEKTGHKPEHYWTKFSSHTVPNSFLKTLFWKKPVTNQKFKICITS